MIDRAIAALCGSYHMCGVDFILLAAISCPGGVLPGERCTVRDLAAAAPAHGHDHAAAAAAAARRQGRAPAPPRHSSPRAAATTRAVGDLLLMGRGGIWIRCGHVNAVREGLLGGKCCSIQLKRGASPNMNVAHSMLRLSMHKYPCTTSSPRVQGGGTRRHRVCRTAPLAPLGPAAGQPGGRRRGAQGGAAAGV